jgi:hypothetical protein
MPTLSFNADIARILDGVNSAKVSSPGLLVCGKRDACVTVV